MLKDLGYASPCGDPSQTEEHSGQTGFAAALSASLILFACSTYSCASWMVFQPGHAINSCVVAPCSACLIALALRLPRHSSPPAAISEPIA
jgi:hypothetical protein